MEHSFWIADSQSLRPGEASRHAVCMPDGSILNRYWDESDKPRDESYAEDVITAQQSGRPAREVFRDLRAAAESGWDFSSRWYGGERQTPGRGGEYPVQMGFGWTNGVARAFLDDDVFRAGGR